MNRTVTLSLGVAAVLVAVFVGSQVIGSPDRGGGLPPSETAVPTFSAEPDRSGGAVLPVGPYLLSDGGDAGVSITITIDTPRWNAEECWSDPGGRIGEEPRLLTALQGPGAECAGRPDGAGLITFQGREYGVYGDACHYAPPPPPHPNVTATTVDELTEALTSQVHRPMRASVEGIMVDGYAGKKVIVQLAGDVPFDGNDCERDEYVLFGLPGDPLARYSLGPRQIDELWIVEVDGQIVVLDAMYYPDTPQRVVDELRAILASASFGVP